MEKPTEQQVFEAQEVLDAHAQAEADGIPYETDRRTIEWAGWDHFPPTRARVENARLVVTESR